MSVTLLLGHSLPRAVAARCLELGWPATRDRCEGRRGALVPTTSLLARVRPAVVGAALHPLSRLYEVAQPSVPISLGGGITNHPYAFVKFGG
eukprot:scaffold50322_cov62-Phaeocystis_antarctica.AAC.7